MDAIIAHSAWVFFPPRSDRLGQIIDIRTRHVVKNVPAAVRCRCRLQGASNWEPYTRFGSALELATIKGPSRLQFKSKFLIRGSAWLLDLTLRPAAQYTGLVAARLCGWYLRWKHDILTTWQIALADIVQIRAPESEKLL